MKRLLVFLLTFSIIISATAVIVSTSADNEVLTIIENFESAGKITDTAFTTKAQVKSVTTTKPIEGSKSLSLQNRSTNNLSVLKLDEAKASFLPDKEYIVSFAYRIDKSADMNQMKFILGNRELHWDCTYLNILGGDESLKNAVSIKNVSGVVYFDISFRTSADGTESVFELQGPIEATGPVKIVFDQIMVREKTAAASEPNVDFENNVYNLKTDTVYYSEAAVQSLVTDKPITGEKSLLIQNGASQFLKLISLDATKYTLKADTAYVFKFNYRLDKSEDVAGMQFVLGTDNNRRYARWDCATNVAYEGTASLRNGCKIVASPDGKYVTVNIRFKTSASGSEYTFCIEGDIAGTTPIKLVIDDLELYEDTDTTVYSPNESFENITSLDSTAYTSQMASVAIADKNSISGKKSLLLQNGVNDFVKILELDSYKYPLKPDTNYVFSFSYKTEKVADMTAMQFVIGARYVRWGCEQRNIYEGNEELMSGASVRYNSTTGVSTFKLRFKTLPDGTEDSFWLQGDIFGVGPTKIMIDDVSLTESAGSDAFSVNESFEKADSLANMAYYSNGVISLASGKNALSGKSSLLVKADNKGWTEAFSLATDVMKLKTNTAYEYSFLCKTENIDALQIQLEGMYNMRYLRVNPKTKTLIAGDYYAFDIKTEAASNGATKITISFKTNNQDQMLKVYVNSVTGGVKLYLDDVTLKTK